LEKAADGYQRMMANQARFRVVLTTAVLSQNAVYVVLRSRSMSSAHPTSYPYGMHPNKVAAMTVDERRKENYP
jgi:hypothetical protein